MLTKAIIEEVLTTKVGTGGSKNTTSLLLYKYRVRMPIFHGLGTDADATPSEQLPLAVCATLPHGEQTKLHINDVVYVEIDGGPGVNPHQMEEFAVSAWLGETYCGGVCEDVI